MFLILATKRGIKQRISAGSFKFLRGSIEKKKKEDRFD